MKFYPPAIVLTLMFSLQAHAGLMLNFKHYTGFDLGSAQDQHGHTGSHAAIEYGSSDHGHDGQLSQGDVQYNTYDTITWGNSASYAEDLYNWDHWGRSGLQFLGQSGTLEAGKEWQNMTLLFHMNKVINHNALTQVWVASMLDLTLENSALPVNLSYNEFLFKETPNRGECDDPTDIGSVCPDTFSLGAEALASLFFDHQGKSYQIDFRLIAEKNASVQHTPGQDYIWTREGEESQVNLQLRLKEIPIPTSVSLCILGLLTLYCRRKLIRP